MTTADKAAHVAKITALPVAAGVAFVPKFKYNLVKVCDVYDGDTITVQAILENDSSETVYRFKVRLNGIDTPEMRTHNLLEKELAQFATAKIREMLLGKIVSISMCERLDMYGRVLANIFTKRPDGQIIMVNNWLLANRLAKAYDGGTKDGWTALTKDEVANIIGGVQLQ